MDEKTFEFLTKMYAEMQQMRQEMQEGFTRVDGEITGIRQEMQSEFKSVRQEMQDGFTRVDQNMVRLENKMDHHHKALYDGYQQCIEGIQEVRQEVSQLGQKVEQQEIKLQVIRGAK